MTQLNGYICKQARLLLNDSRYAILLAIVFALLPYTDWISVAIIALITLRQGWRGGLNVLMPTMVAHLAYSLLAVPVVTAIVNNVLTFVPCYFIAGALFLTVSWRVVASVLFFQLLLAAILIQIFIPEFIMVQSSYITSLLNQAQPNNQVVLYLKDVTGMKQMIIANYLFGIQMLSVAFSAIMSLMLARSMQSRLYYPGGYKQELLTFRANKISFLMLVLISFAALQHNVLAMDILPAMLCYFLLAGLSLSANALVKRNTRAVMILLLTPLVLMPYVMLPVYIILGSLDSLFNLRTYFAEKIL